MFGRFFNAIWHAADGELLQLRWTLIAILSATMVGIIPILVFSWSIERSILWTLAPWLFTVYRLFAIKRFIKIHLTGEVLELLKVSVSGMAKAVEAITEATTVTITKPPATEATTTVTIAKPATTTTTVTTSSEVVTRGSTGIFDNPFIRIYLSVISQIFLAQTALFLMLPLIVNYTMGSTTAVIVIVMLIAIIALDNFTSFRKLSRWAVKATVVVYAVGLVFVLFPHTGLYIGGFTNKVDVVSMTTAMKLNELDALQKAQQEKIDNEYVDSIIAWQKANPGVKLPIEHQLAIERARGIARLK